VKPGHLDVTIVPADYALGVPPIRDKELLDIASTLQGAKSLGNGVRLVPGNYIAIPREHGKALTKMSGLKMMDGFLVPKEAEKKDVYDAVTSVMPDLAYLSLSVKVSPTKMTNCLLPMPA
jgi:hypothetical protein